MSQRIESTIGAYASAALTEMQASLSSQSEMLCALASEIAASVERGGRLFVSGSGHSSLFPLELFHRAGGASFVVPIVADFLLPCAGPSVVRALERTNGVMLPLLRRARPRSGEMIWIASQSGINAAVLDLAFEAKKQGLRTVAFTSIAHSSSMPSRHPSGKRLFEVCDRTVDLRGRPGDALVDLPEGVTVGPLSLLAMVLLGHSIVSAASAELEAKGVRCVYTSVNTASGEERNRMLEELAAERDWLLR